MTSENWKSGIRISIALCLLTLSAAPEVMADTNSSSPNKYGNQRQFRPPNADRDYAVEHLKGPIDIPNVPPFTGRTKFLSGLRYPNDPSGYRLGMTFAAMEEPTQILDWYKTALGNYQWKLVENPQDPNSLTASKGGATFTLSLSPNRVVGYRTVVVVSYKAHAGK
ncbi:MAG TPA: hypothetical protein V6C76_08055 [Drouetiella sp.]